MGDGLCLSTFPCQNSSLEQPANPKFQQNFGRTTGGAFSKFLKCSSPHLFINRIHKKFSLFAQRLDISSGIATVESKFAKKAEIDGAEFQV
jgi:hypothetical protein